MSDFFDDVKSKTEKNQRDIVTLRTDIGKQCTGNSVGEKEQASARKDRDELRSAVEDLR